MSTKTNDKSVQKHPEVKVVLVTPAMAENWLISNIGNRPLDMDRVNGFLDQMRKGEWMLSTDSIGFDTNGKLVNGQHRLNAVVRYGKPVQFLVSTGIQPEAFTVIDTGKNRTPGDILGIGGFSSPAHKAGICRFVMAYKKGKVITIKASVRESGITNQEILHYAETHTEKLEEAYEVSTRVRKKFRVGLAPREVGGLYWLFAEFSKGDALKFFELYASGENMSSRHPVLTLRNKFIQESTSQRKYGMRDRLAWAILAWNKFRKGGDMTRIRWNGETDDFPKPI